MGGKRRTKFPLLFSSPWRHVDGGVVAPALFLLFFFYPSLFSLSRLFIYFFFASLFFDAEVCCGCGKWWWWCVRGSDDCEVWAVKRPRRSGPSHARLTLDRCVPSHWLLLLLRYTCSSAAPAPAVTGSSTRSVSCRCDQAPGPGFTKLPFEMGLPPPHGYRDNHVVTQKTEQ